MAAKYPIDRVSCARGAPMGRATYGTPESSTGKLRLFRVPLDQGGYDKGGAYWGCGTPLYCVYEPAEDGYMDFVRAWSRKGAAEALGIPSDRLIVPIDMPLFGGRRHAG